MRHKQSAKQCGRTKRFWALLLSMLLVCNFLIPGHALAAGMEDESDPQTEAVELLSQTETTETTAQTDTESTQETSSEATETEVPTEDVEELKETEVVEEDATYHSSTGSTSVTAYVPAGSFTEAVKLRVVELYEGSTAYQEAEDALAGTVDYDEMRAFDICFVNGDGIEIEPALPISISIDTVLDTQEDVAENSVQITHIDDGPQIVAAEMAGSVSVDDTIVSAEFTVESFSIFTLSWNNSRDYRLTIHCIDNQGNEIGTNAQGSINSNNGTQVSNIAPSFSGYQFSKAVIASTSNPKDAAVSQRTVTLLRRSNNNWQYDSDGYWRKVGSNEHIYFIYENDNAPIKVYVYVASRDVAGNPMSAEMLELLGINANTIDGNGYFPAGEIYLDRSFLNGKGNAANTPGSPLIQSAADWNAVNSALSEMVTSTLTGNYAANRGNHVSSYLSQAGADIGYSWGSQRTALFRWNDTTSYGFADQTVKYHLDLRFSTKTITFITGNNNIRNKPGANDGTTVDSRVYITGSTILDPRNVRIPDGYKFAGYYRDADFNEEWNGIGTPLNQDQIVYIKIVPQNNVVINYKVQEGQGTVTDPSRNNAAVQSGMEHFNPVTGTVTGSSAEAASGWTFAGWYLDETLTDQISTDAKYVPAVPSGGWQEGAEYTYYAKFVHSEMLVTVIKDVTGNMGDRDRKFSFTVKTEDGDEKTFSLKDDEIHVIENLAIGSTVTLIESENAGYTVSVQYGSYDESGTFQGSTVQQTENGGFSITLEEGKDTILVTNNKDAVPDTGILLDSVPYILILMLCALAAVGSITLYRRGKVQ